MAAERSIRRAVELRVLGRRFITRVDGLETELPPSGQRALACLAVSRRSVSRRSLVGALWPDSPSTRGHARLRNVLWKVNSVVPGLLRSTEVGVFLAADVVVDLDEARAVCGELLRAGPDGLVGAYPEFLQYDILPDWDEEWLDEERRAFTVLRIRALEQVAHRCLDRERFFEAEQACQAIISAEPYRESARLLLAEVHVAEGNAGLALQKLAEFEVLLRRDLGIAPNHDIRSLVSAIRA